MNCLHLAATNGHLSLCEKLVYKHKFHLDINDSVALTALHFSALNGSYQLVKFFVNKGTDTPHLRKRGINCVHTAALAEYLNLSKTLAEDHNIKVYLIENDRLTPLHYCALYNSYKLIKFFVENGIDILLKTTRGLNCLHIAALSGHLNLCKTLASNHNINVNLIDNYGFTPLHYYVLY